MSRKENILNAWIMVEHLTEGNINIRDKSIKSFDGKTDFYSMFAQKIQERKFDKNQKDAGIVVYFEIFGFNEVVEIIRKKYNLEPTDEEIRVGEKFSFALGFDKNLALREDLTFVTISTYIRNFKEIPIKNTFNEYEREFKTQISQLFMEDEDKENIDFINKKVKFNDAMNYIINKYEVNLKNCRFQLVNNLDTDAANMHSFFVEDLERAKKDCSSNLDRYLLGKANKRINLDSKNTSVNFNPDIFEKILQPKNYPIARFPSKTKYSLSFMQQVAVNLAIGYDNSQIRSVNGPPGTGKTTLLKDIFAELLVRQAYEIANLSDKVIKANPTKGYYENICIGKMPENIAENNIIVASSNNSAVQNIVNELPLIQGIDDKFVEELKEADYFWEIANSELSSEWIEDKESGKKQEKLIMKRNPGEDMCWGTFSLEGGKKSNMANIIMNIKHMLNHLEKEYISDKGVYEKFLTYYNQVENIRRKAQRYYKNIQEYEKCCILLKKLQENYKKTKETKRVELECKLAQYREMNKEKSLDIDDLKKQYEDIEQSKEMVDKNRQSIEWCIQLLLNRKPRFFSLPKTKKEYKKKTGEVGQRLEECISQSEEIECERRKINSKIQERQNELDELLSKEKQEKCIFDEWIIKREGEITKVEEKCKNYKNRISDKNFKKLDMGLEYEELQLSNPWFEEIYRIAQSKLFIAALKVRKQFLYDNLKSIKKAIMVWNRQKEGIYEKTLVLSAWNWINMAIPVISSTFASFSRMCENLGTSTLGHLFIDEGGQALPQASVGAINRSKHIMVLGDPEQIKPVLTLDSNVLAMLGEHFNVSEKYLSGTTSTQTLADEISKYGFYKEQDEAWESWVGIPLWVHRRCKSPMFKISNKISYNGYMVQGVEGKGKVDWFDIGGTASDKYVEEQGRFLLRKIEAMIQNDKKIIDRNEKDTIYVITPFANVAYQLAKLLKNIEFTRYDEKNKPTNVGTIHTFQGKEAPIVFLVLGADKNSRGAARWAVEEPNMMNVAVTRSKEEFYIIGDKRLYLDLGSDVVRDTYSIIKNYNTHQMDNKVGDKSASEIQV